METILCTLYNSLYLDKGLVLYDSLCESSKHFKLYVLCMDDKCYEVLKSMNHEYIVPIKLEDFECGDNDLLEAKNNRSFGEYCWTCSSSLILYILETYKEPICTYIDADMYFYQDPEILIDEMRDAGKKVMITPHRFSPDNKYLERNGIYCVEFNTFTYEEDSLKVLKRWRSDCLDCCKTLLDGKHYGDQKYLDLWPEEYPDIIHVCENIGAGIAPWNIEWYKKSEKEGYFVYFDNETKPMPIVFYHFHNVTYIDRNTVKTGVYSGKYNVDYSLLDNLYSEYLIKVELKKKILETRFGIDCLMKRNHTTMREEKWKEWILQFSLVRWLYSYLRPVREQYVISLG